MAWAFVSQLAFLKNRAAPVFPYAAGGAASVFALFTAGFFEYNFADSEIIVLFLILLTVPFAVSKRAEP